MMESFGRFAKRKLADAGSAVYRKLIFPFVKWVFSTLIKFIKWLADTIKGLINKRRSAAA